MKKYLLFLFIFFTSIIFAEKIVIRFNEPTAKVLDLYKTVEYDIASYKPGVYLDIVSTEQHFSELRTTGFDVSIYQTESQSKAHMETNRELDGYRTYQDVLTEMQTIEALYPDICKLYDIGDSWGKIYAEAGNSNYDDFDHEIWAMKISDNVLIEEDEPSVYYMGTHHAREPISTEVAMTVLNYLADNYNNDPGITEKLNNTQVWIIPLVNPNGHKIVTDESEIWWRKNVRDNNENGELDYYNESGPDGVDPNRNYGWEWGPVGTSDEWDSNVYHGPTEFSEPEIQAMRDLMADHNFVTGITYHSYSELVLYPFGYNDGVVAPDRDALQNLAVSMAETIPGQYSGYYTPEASWELYACMGTTDDWAYGEHGIFSFTIELATEFIPAANQVSGICSDNMDAAMILLDRVNNSTLTGHITNTENQESMIAEIFIEGIDDTGVNKEPHKSDEEFGRYYRLLLPGTYNVTFSAYGFESVTYENVVITEAGQTILDAALNSVTAVNVSGTIANGETGEAIEDATVEILDLEDTIVYTNTNGEFLISDIFVGVYNIRISAVDYSTVVQEIVLTEQTNVFNFEMSPSTAESFETGIFDEVWSFSGDEEWFIDNSQAFDGYYSARSGNIGANSSTTLTLVLDITEDSYLTFYKKVSCEEDADDNYDYFIFKIDGQEQDRWDGEDDWSEESYPVSAGMHTFDWKYIKDGYVSEGSDCAWIDFVTLPIMTGAEDTEIQYSPESVQLQNYPNPFNPSTTISFNISLEDVKDAALEIYNVKGQKVKTFPNLQTNKSSNHQIIWNGKDNSDKSVTSGIYFYKLQAGKYSQTKKMILMK
jgi:carboxypeptidase T